MVAPNQLIELGGKLLSRRPYSDLISIAGSLDWSVDRLKDQQQSPKHGECTIFLFPVTQCVGESCVQRSSSRAPIGLYRALEDAEGASLRHTAHEADHAL